MVTKSPTELAPLRQEIAAVAARMIAEDGADYRTAKRKAAQQILGNRRLHGDFLPNNSQIVEEVRLYNALFFADTQPARLAHLRRLAVEIMSEMGGFNPYLTGAVCNGTAGDHADIHLQLFVDSAKDVEIYLLNKNVQFEVSESENSNRPAKHARNGGSEPLEILSFIYKREGVHLALYETDALRGSIRPGGTAADSGEYRDRVDLAAARLLITDQNQP
ncbi:hypothetical protein [Glaciimonas sp. PCH181]|uniref:hypothetical protein n=1 Tax=Glaciimonas sp. PCH181 TaxID=2133943 RepID=UPI000D3969BB|nr:hypothetical protein [Glaciimonas sp. PCH181]PUA20550.1 hypothetical protein C7W93_12625 [Glaciimonas sp. PCH181]